MMDVCKWERWLVKILRGSALVLLLAMFGTALFIPMRLSLSRGYKAVWEEVEPQSYYLKFIEIWPSDGFHWEVYVVDGEPQWTQMEQTLDNGRSSWFSEKTVSVEVLFDFAAETCIDRGFWKCGVTYDFWYRYPTWVVSYPVVILEVEEFIKCDQYPDDCALLVPELAEE